jgi:hypothetical protein
VAFRATVGTTIYTVVILASFLNSSLRSVKVTQIDPVLGVRQPSTIETMYLMLASRLRILVNVKTH